MVTLNLVAGTLEVLALAVLSRVVLVSSSAIGGAGRFTATPGAAKMEYALIKRQNLHLLHHNLVWAIDATLLAPVAVAIVELALVESADERPKSARAAR